jgi:serine/threonine protein kinase
MKVSWNARHHGRSRNIREHQPVQRDRQTVGRWELCGLLGQGRWSQVFAGRPLEGPPDRPADYAIKLARPDATDRRIAASLIEREAAVGQQVSHPHLIAILASDLENARPHIAMPLLSGAPLAQILEAQRRLSTSAALWMVRQVAEAATELHTSGWIHCDIKPANIFVSPTGHATLFDLGFALRLGTHECAANAGIRGTLAYTAPEMISASTAVTERSDVYSLGITLFELLVGHVPFPERDSAGLARAHLSGRMPNVRRLLPSLSPEVVQLISSMLSKEPLRRPVTGELLDRLTDLEIATFDDRVA